MIYSQSYQKVYEIMKQVHVLIGISLKLEYSIMTVHFNHQMHIIDCVSLISIYPVTSYTMISESL